MLKIIDNVHETGEERRAWKSLARCEKNPDFCEMCEEITNFMARKRNAVMEPVNENWSRLSFLCDVMEKISAMNAWM